jgi:hypothetical protein
MTAVEPRIEDLGEHRFLVSVDADDDLVEVQLYVDPIVLERIGLAGADELRIVSAAIDFLLERQHADDLPSRVDLDEVASVYEGFVDDIRGRIGSDHAQG